VNEAQREISKQNRGVFTWSGELKGRSARVKKYDQQMPSGKKGKSGGKGIALLVRILGGGGGGMVHERGGRQGGTEGKNSKRLNKLRQEFKGSARV